MGNRSRFPNGVHVAEQENLARRIAGVEPELCSEMIAGLPGKANSDLSAHCSQDISDHFAKAIHSGLVGAGRLCFHHLPQHPQHFVLVFPKVQREIVHGV